MIDERSRLMAWKPGADGYSHDDVILAVGLLCREKRYLLDEVLAWLGTPDRALGNFMNGQLVYFSQYPVCAREDEAFYQLEVLNGLVIEFGTIARHRNNAIAADGITHFNILDVMETFNKDSFMRPNMNVPPEEHQTKE